VSRASVGYSNIVLPSPVATRRSGLARAGAAAWALVGIAVLVLLAGWAIGRLMPVVLPFAVAVLLATLLRPIAARLERRGARPAVAAIIAVVGAVLVFVLAITLILPPFIARLTDLGSSLQEGVERVAYEIGSVFGMDRAGVDRMLTDAANRMRERAGGQAMAGITSLAGALASTVLVIFLSFFLVKDGRRMWTWLLDLVPQRRRDRIDDLGERSWTVLTAYTRGIVFVATVDAVLIGLALLIVGVPLALPLIVLTWIAAFFPIIGAIVAGAAAVLVALVTNGPTEALIVLAAILVVQQVEGNVLYPVVVGPRLKLHPIVVLVAVAMGGTLAGIPGAFLAVPIATICGALLGYQREMRACREDPLQARRGVMVGNGAA
jgi:predicted PurR-regulated permease PerM